jgi:hypothetical protein
MSIRSSILALAAIAAVTATSLTPANAWVFGPRHFVRVAHPFWFAHHVGPGVGWCRRGLVYICQ